MTRSSRGLYLLDTNICVYAMNSRPQVVLERMEAVIAAGHALALSSVTVHELWFGVHRSARTGFNAARLRALRATLEVYPLTEEAAAEAGRIRASLALTGTPIGPYDTLIAGHALSLGAVVATNNVGGFRRVEGLRVEDWTE